jgi:hypothetical protein
VFVSHPFDDLVGVPTEEFRGTVRAALASAPPVRLAGGAEGILEGFFVTENFGAPLPGEVRSGMVKSDIGIVDLSGLRPNVLFELGYLTASSAHLILIAHTSSDHPFVIPADVSDVLVGLYTSAADLLRLLERRITEVVQEMEAAGTYPSRSSAAVWFDPGGTGSVSLICSPETEKTRFADRANSNYLFIDNLEDRDALLEASSYLARAYPDRQVIRYSSDSIPADALSSDLLILGGPGEPDGPGNDIARDVLARIRTGVSFADDCESVEFNDMVHLPKFRSDGSVSRDFGYVLRCVNPYSSRHSLMLMAGVYTIGTLGSVLAFGDHPMGKMNCLRAQRAARGGAGSTLEFEAFFPVESGPSGGPVVPMVDATMIQPLAN